VSANPSHPALHQLSRENKSTPATTTDLSNALVHLAMSDGEEELDEVGKVPKDGREGIHHPDVDVLVLVEPQAGPIVQDALSKAKQSEERGQPTQEKPAAAAALPRGRGFNLMGYMVSSSVGVRLVST